ncbi:MAG: hypothetical protein M1813_007539 [Trichoglossum hirsutum]|nr:MAG: hypothetical protein M1813_007539 [Trichoglossum hirsutum]
MRKRTRRKPLLPFFFLLLVASLVVVAFLFSHVYTLITLLFEDGSRDLVDRGELNRLRREGVVDEKIPKIIHQTYANESVTGRWEVAQMTCIKLHEGWEYMLWTDAKARYFIEQEYNWFLHTYDSYPYMIQRADAIRYFVLAHYGGIYIDLDEGCILPLDPLLSLPAFLRLTTPTGISNDIMGSVPSHPFFIQAIRSLQSYARNWYVPYITVMYTTGPLFLSVIWKEYMRRDAKGDERVRVLGVEEGEVGGGKWGFWIHAQGGGSSWHGRDAKVIFWMESHWKLLALFGFLLTGFFLLFLYRLYAHLSFFQAPTRYRRKSITTSPSQRLLDIFSSLSPSSPSARERLEEHRIE